MKRCGYCGRGNADDASHCAGCGTEFPKSAAESGSDEKDSASMERVLVRRFYSHPDADMAAAKLEAYGIECWVEADDCAGAYPNLTMARGVRLLVRKPDAEKAGELLDAELSAGEQEELSALASAEELQPVVPKDMPDVGKYIAVLILGVVLGVVSCLVYQQAGKLGEKIYRYDLNHDGRVDEMWIYRGGHINQFFKDRNFDGNWDVWIDYDSQGLITGARYDHNFDGKPDTFVTKQNGQIISEQWDTDFNGTPDATATYKNDIVQQMEWKPNGSTNTTLREIYSNGILSEAQRDTDNDGVLDEVVRYDAFHNPISTNPFPLRGFNLP